ncbi:MAG: esterase family protein [Vicinamibacteria bacterium]
MTRVTTRWYSERLGQELLVVRWGEVGKPVLLFPTAGGDAEEIERFHVIESLAPLLESGRIKVYSCDSVAGRSMLESRSSPEHQMWMLNQFHHFVDRELVPAIRSDCRSDSISVIAAGSSIGAFNALAILCRFPDAFSHALCLSGTYDLGRFFQAGPTQDLYFSSPLHFLPGLAGETLHGLQKRFVLLASGEGKAENIDESWRVAHLLGEKGVPNRVDSWGADWPHDWPTWRKMLPQYLDELTR